MISIAQSIANDRKHRDCKCFPLVLTHINVASLVSIILEYAHCTEYKHPFARDGDLCLHADVTPHRSVCRRTKDIKHSNTNNFVPRAVITMTEQNLETWTGLARHIVMISIHLTTPRHKDVTMVRTIDLDQGYLRFLFDPRSSPKALLEMIRRENSQQKITVSMATMFFKACMVLRDELCEILYEIHHECPLTALIYA